MALEITNLRVLLAAAEDSKALGPEVSMLKIKGSEIIQDLAELKMHALGHDALPYVRDALDIELARGCACSTVTTNDQCAADLRDIISTSARPPSTPARLKFKRTLAPQMILGL